MDWHRLRLQHSRPDHRRVRRGLSCRSHRREGLGKRAPLEVQDSREVPELSQAVLPEPVFRELALLEQADQRGEPAGLQEREDRQDSPVQLEEREFPVPAVYWDRRGPRAWLERRGQDSWERE